MHKCMTYHHQPVDLELVEGLGQTEVVEGEEEGAEEADHHHRQEPVLAVGVGRGTADDAEKCQDLEIFRAQSSSVVRTLGQIC